MKEVSRNVKRHQLVIRCFHVPYKLVLKNFIGGSL